LHPKRVEKSIGVVPVVLSKNRPFIAILIFGRHFRVFFVLGRQNSYKNWHFTCYTVKFAKQNSSFNLS
jgi:hypothetical protein